MARHLIRRRSGKPLINIIYFAVKFIEIRRKNSDHSRLYRMLNVGTINDFYSRMIFSKPHIAFLVMARSYWKSKQNINSWFFHIIEQENWLCFDHETKESSGDILHGSVSPRYTKCIDHQSGGANKSNEFGMSVETKAGKQRNNMRFATVWINDMGSRLIRATAKKNGLIWVKPKFSSHAKKCFCAMYEGSDTCESMVFIFIFIKRRIISNCCITNMQGLQN